MWTLSQSAMAGLKYVLATPMAARFGTYHVDIQKVNRPVWETSETLKPPFWPIGACLGAIGAHYGFGVRGVSFRRGSQSPFGTFLGSTNPDPPNVPL